jgi:hypothetical protein
MSKDRVFQIVRVADEHGTTSWFWTNQQPDEEIERDCLIGPFDTEQQAKDDAISTLALPQRPNRHQGLPPIPKPSPEGISEFWTSLSANWPCGSAVRRTMGRIMPEYRICYVTPDEHIATAPVRIVCENDLAAVQYAQSLHDRNSYQIWQGRRLVARETRRASYLQGTAQRRSA